MEYFSLAWQVEQSIWKLRTHLILTLVSMPWENLSAIEDKFPRCDQTMEQILWELKENSEKLQFHWIKTRFKEPWHMKEVHGISTLLPDSIMVAYGNEYGHTYGQDDSSHCFSSTMFGRWRIPHCVVWMWGHTKWSSYYKVTWRSKWPWAINIKSHSVDERKTSIGTWALKKKGSVY